MRKKLLTGIAILVVASFVLNVAFYLVWPDVSKLKKERPGKTAFMTYRERQWQREGALKNINQQWVSLARISPYAIKAVIIAEDDKFWAHEGFDFEAIQKAVEKDLIRSATILVEEGVMWRTGRRRSTGSWSGEGLSSRIMRRC